MTVFAMAMDRSGRNDIAHPCGIGHSGAFEWIIDRSKHGQNKCPNCSEPYDIVDILIFNQLSWKYDKTKGALECNMARVARINFQFPNVRPIEFATLLYTSADEQKIHISKLFWGDETLFTEPLDSKSLKGKLRACIGEPWAIQDSRIRRDALLEVFRKGVYVEVLDNEPYQTLFQRHSLFARRVVPYHTGNEETRNRLYREAGIDFVSPVRKRPATLGLPADEEQVPNLAPPPAPVRPAVVIPAHRTDIAPPERSGCSYSCFDFVLTILAIFFLCVIGCVYGRSQE